MKIRIFYNRKKDVIDKITSEIIHEAIPMDTFHKGEVFRIGSYIGHVSFIIGNIIIATDDKNCFTNSRPCGMTKKEIRKYQKENAKIFGLKFFNIL